MAGQVHPSQSSLLEFLRRIVDADEIRALIFLIFSILEAVTRNLRFIFILPSQATSTVRDMDHLQMVFPILLILFLVSSESFRYTHYRSVSRRATVAVAVVPTPEILDIKEEIAVNPVISDETIPGPVIVVKSRGFGKSASVSTTYEEGAEKGKRSEAKKLYQLQRKIDKRSSSLANMIGSSPKDSGQNFKNSDYV